MVFELRADDPVDIVLDLVVLGLVEELADLRPEPVRNARAGSRSGRLKTTPAFQAGSSFRAASTWAASSSSLPWLAAMSRSRETIEFIRPSAL